MNRRGRIVAWCFSLMAVVMLTSAPAAAGEFVINPLRVTLDRTTRATEVVVRNDDKTPLRMQVQAMTWTQSVDGVDQYEPAEGLLYFPRTMEIPPGESRIVRVGVRAAPVTREETYRLFIEELPPASAAERAGTGNIVARLSASGRGRICRARAAGTQGRDHAPRHYGRASRMDGRQ